jgi:hypothetical protein
MAIGASSEKCGTKPSEDEASMIPVCDLFESHLNVADLQRSMCFFGQTLGLELAEVSWKLRAAFYWIGGQGNSMLGLWEVGGKSPEAEPPRCLSVGSR